MCIFHKDLEEKKKHEKEKNTGIMYKRSRIYS